MKVRLKIGDKIITRQLTGGSGYQASNSKRLTIGLGLSLAVDELEVQWPSGIRKVYRDIQADQEWLILESSIKPLMLPRR